MNLKEWRAQRTPRTLDNATPQLNRAIIEQSNLGWQNFIEGFWSKTWLQLQEAHFKAIDSPRSAILLLSKVQRRIWQIPWHMWLERNSHLHNKKHSVHPQEEKNLNHEITYEWTTGHHTLEEHHRHYFQGQLTELLKKTATRKINWLFGVWAARETKNTGYLVINSHANANAALREKYIKWKQKVAQNTN